MSDYTRTPNYNLFKPTPLADVDLWGDHWNINADILDGILKAHSDTLAYLLGLGPGPGPGPGTDSGFLLEDGSGMMLLEDGSGFLVQES